MELVAPSPHTDSQPPELLWLFLGNPARGDDAVGFLLYQLLQAEPAWQTAQPGVELGWYFQLCPEQVFDLQGKSGVVFIDADARFAEGIQFTRISAADNPVIHSHSLAPETLLGLYQQVFNSAPPPAWLLSIGSVGFELGAGLSPASQQNMQLAQQQLLADIMPIEHAHATFATLV